MTTIMITTQNADLIKAFKSMAKASGATIKIKYSPKIEYNQTMKDYKSGKIKAHKSAKEAFKEAKII